MSLTNEAAYLYVYSKKLTKINRLLKSLSKKAHKHKTKHDTTTREEKKHKHRKKHAKTVKEIKDLMKEHNKILTRLKQHQVAFAHTLHKKHKI